eukprot:Nitzschia sp. Nitz4//scaffold353_size16344//9878//11048//NITZ4_008864-RA/size16344-snap-gene-0.18-mRNA-1//-1//CDS//3329548922//8694//frame0
MSYFCLPDRGSVSVSPMGGSQASTKFLQCLRRSSTRDSQKSACASYTARVTLRVCVLVKFKFQ